MVITQIKRAPGPIGGTALPAKFGDTARAEAMAMEADQMSTHPTHTARQSMSLAAGSLRSLVEKWLWPTRATSVRVTDFSRTALGGTRFVRVETSQQERPVSFLFFRHADGTWQVFPPAIQRPMMRCH